MAHGLYDTQIAWAAVTNIDDYIVDLVLLNIGVAYFAVGNFSVRVITAVIAYSEIRFHRLGITSRVWKVAYVIAETVGANIPGTASLAQPAAQARVIADVRHYFPLNLNVRNLNQGAFDNAQNAIHALDNTFPSSATTPINITFDPAAAGAGAHPVAGIDTAVLIIRVLAWIWYEGEKRSYALSIYAIMLVSTLKMGTATNRFINKIVNGVESELHEHLHWFESDIIRGVWDRLGRFINQNNIGVIVADWERWIPQAALRLRLTAQQAHGEGLTALSTIKKAITTHPTFPWEQVNALLPTDAANVVAAMNAVGANDFYGFSKDLGVVRSTNYKSYAWCAKELLIRKDGMTTLNNYRGWTNSPANQAALDVLINNFINAPQGPQTYAVGSAAHTLVNTMAVAAAAATGVHV